MSCRFSANRARWFLLFALFLLFSLCIFGTIAIPHKDVPVRIGVLMHLDGPDGTDIIEPLEWLKEDINQGGGIDGRPVELEYKNLDQGDLHTLARELLDDPSVSIVIGLEKSEDFYAVAPLFLEKKKVLIALASSSDISRDFGGNPYLWRTFPGDTSQIKGMLWYLHAKGIHRIALVCENSRFGKTFRDWTGFLAISEGMDLVSLTSFEIGSGDDIDEAVAKASASHPEVIIGVADPKDAVRIKRALDRTGKPVPLFLTDRSYCESIIGLLGDAPEGVQGIVQAPATGSGFREAYFNKYHRKPAEYAAAVYDAFLLAAYSTAYRNNHFFVSEDESMAVVSRGSGENISWDPPSVRHGLALIRNGSVPHLDGAMGPFDYHPEFRVDPLMSQYSVWAVGNGEFHIVETIAGPAVSSEKGSRHVHDHPGAVMPPYHVHERPPGNSLSPVPGKNVAAVIVAGSRSWENYRHQSDALEMYAVLWHNDVPDENIILMSYDDIPWLEENKKHGDLHHLPGDENLRMGAVIDYTGNNVSFETFKHAMTGNSSFPNGREVLKTNESSDILVYISGHGEKGYLGFPDGSVMSADDLAMIIDEMYKNHRYHRMLIIVDSCYAESLGKKISAPGVLFLSSSAENEESLAAHYDPEIDQWLSNDVAERFFRIIQDNPDISLSDLYVKLYHQVYGSHVRLFNEKNFEDLNIPLKEFITP